LLRIIAGTEPISGKREEGYNVIRGFYAQHQLEALHVNNEILDELKQAGSDKTELELRQILGCFLFSDDEVFKKIKVLSGGEKSRVALAKTLISEANFLLLDEPTNHLDFISENILIQALQQYQGTYVVVSHNRHFISQVANKIWYIENRQIKEYPGTFQEFMYWKNNIQQTASPGKEVHNKGKNKIRTKKDTTPKNQSENHRKQLQHKLEGLEDEIQELETEIRLTEEHMAKPAVYADPDALGETTQTYDKLRVKLESLQEDWEEIALQIDEIDQNK
jgi:ATP-binding cassette subfamily F protein 3